MKVELFPFQKKALAGLRMQSAEALGSYRRTHSPQVVSFTAPSDKGFLRTMNDDSQLLVKLFALGVEKIRLSLVHISVVRNMRTYGVHIVSAGIAEKEIHCDAGQAEEKCSHQGDSPLQGKLFHDFSSSIMYPSPMRFRIGS